MGVVDGSGERSPFRRTPIRLLAAAARRDGANRVGADPGATAVAEVIEAPRRNGKRRPGRTAAARTSRGGMRCARDSRGVGGRVKGGSRGGGRVGGRGRLFGRWPCSRVVRYPRAARVIWMASSISPLTKLLPGDSGIGHRHAARKCGCMHGAAMPQGSRDREAPDRAAGSARTEWT